MRVLYMTEDLWLTEWHGNGVSLYRYTLFNNFRMTMRCDHGQVSEFATKEYAVEQSLDKMQAAWTGVKFEYGSWHATGTTVLRGVDDLQQMLEEHLVKTQSLATSPYIGPFEDRVKLWLEKLNLVQEVISRT